MIRVDYEGAWKELKGKYGEEYIVYEGGDSVEDVMNELEKKYTFDYPNIKENTKRFWFNKYMEILGKYMVLKNKDKK